MTGFCPILSEFAIVLHNILPTTSPLADLSEVMVLSVIPNPITRFFFGFIRAYIISICIFSGVHIVYNYDKWPLNLDKLFTFPYLEKGSNYLLKVFPNEKTYRESKEKIEDL